MMDCWKEDPNERPSFIQLIPILEEMMTEDTPYYYFRLLDQNQPCYREASTTNTSKTSTLDTKQLFLQGLYSLIFAKAPFFSLDYYRGLGEKMGAPV